MYSLAAHAALRPRSEESMFVRSSTSALSSPLLLRCPSGLAYLCSSNINPPFSPPNVLIGDRILNVRFDGPHVHTRPTFQVCIYIFTKVSRSKLYSAGIRLCRWKPAVSKSHIKYEVRRTSYSSSTSFPGTYVLLHKDSSLKNILQSEACRFKTAYQM
jgi:hypothetical protein